jgi:hypothetical protein
VRRTRRFRRELGKVEGKREEKRREERTDKGKRTEILLYV